MEHKFVLSFPVHWDNHLFYNIILIGAYTAYGTTVTIDQNRDGRQVMSSADEGGASQKLLTQQMQLLKNVA